MINSAIMMKGLLVTYFIISVMCVVEKNYPKALYWFAAGLITFSVIWGMR